MNLLRAALLILVVVGIAIAAMLFVRRKAPDGGYFNDSDRAAGVFGVLATGFALLLGFLVFLAFSSYDASRTGAETEALTVAQQVETAQFFAAQFAGELTGELVCYARSVVHSEWDQMEAGELDEEINPWAAELFRTLVNVQPNTASEEAAYGKWLDQTSSREEARSQRIHGAVGIIPTPLWVVLFFLAGTIFVYMLFFADSGERAPVQALLVGSVVATMTALLLVLGFLDSPFSPDVGGLRPVAMERTLLIMDQALQVTGLDQPLPCDPVGNPL